MVVYANNFSIQKGEAWELPGVPDQPGLHKKTLFSRKQ